MAQNINDLPEETLTEILSNLPQKRLVLCRTVCQKWRDVIDQHCPMKDTVYIEEDDKFLDRKLELIMSSCGLYYFQKTTPNISLTHPQNIKKFKFYDIPDLPWFYRSREKYGLNVGNARGLLLQIAPFVEHLRFHPIYFNHHILSGIHPFLKLRELHIGYDKYIMQVNLRILFSHRFPLLDSLVLCLYYSNETLMDEAYVNFFNFLANHRQTFKTLSITINYNSGTRLCDLPDSTLEMDLSKKVKAILSEEQLQIESLELSLPPKYVPAWVPIIASQKKLNYLTVVYTREIEDTDTTGFKFSEISPGIVSSVCTLRTVILDPLSRVTSDGLDWILLDLSPLRDAANLTELALRGANVEDYGGTHRPSENEGPWIINLHEINSTSLKSLRIDHFVCSSMDLQTLVDYAPVLETLLLYHIRAPRKSEHYAESGVHGGIIKSFVAKKNMKNIYVYHSLNYSHEKENEKLKKIKKFYNARVEVDAGIFELRYR